MTQRTPLGRPLLSRSEAALPKIVHYLGDWDLHIKVGRGVQIISPSQLLR